MSGERLTYRLDDGRWAIDCPLCSQAAGVELRGNHVSVTCWGGCPPAEVDRAFEPMRDRVLAELGGEQRAALRFRSPEEIRAQEPENVRWVWEGYLARGAITLMAGKPKGGKSTLALAVTDALVSGAPMFLGRWLAPGPVIYVSEEGDGTVRPKLPANGTPVRVLTRSAAWPKPSWPELIKAAVTESEALGASLLVIDTLAFWSDLSKDEEKDAGAAQATMAALVAAAESGLAVLLIHHQRKAGGEDGDALRGSGGFAGAADAILELERVPDARASNRRLLALARWENAPGMLLIDRDEATGGWLVLGEGVDRTDAARIGWRDALLNALPIGEPGATYETLRDTLGKEKPKWKPALDDLIREGAASRSGEGKRGSPYLFRRAPAVFVPESRPSARTETGDDAPATVPSRRHPSRREEADGIQPDHPLRKQASSDPKTGGRVLDEDELVSRLKRDFGARELDPDDEAAA